MYLFFEDIQAGRLRESDRVQVSPAAAPRRIDQASEAGETVTSANSSTAGRGVG
jgi:hypothetical protein